MAHKISQHIFIIPDGNRRWARARRKGSWFGHSQGRKRFHEISEASFEAGVPYFTFWAASEDNLTKRSPAEIAFLINLLRVELESSVAEKLLKNKIRFRVFGRWEELIPDKELHGLIRALEKDTSEHDNRNLTILLGYSGKVEWAEASKSMLISVLTSNNVEIDAIDFEYLKRFSWSRDLPPVDVEIRTGEKKTGWSHRSSGALPFLTTDSACFHTKIFWPDFTEERFKKVLRGFADYERRFGA